MSGKNKKGEKAHEDEGFAFGGLTLKSLRGIFVRAITKNSEWPDKDELLDVLYWLKQVYSALLGLVWGLIPFHGLLAIGLYVLISSIIGHLYITLYQGQDEEQMGGFWELAKEGFGSAFASFMIVWIIVYSGIHGY